MKRVLRQLKKYTPLIVLSIFLAVLTVAGNLIPPIMFGNAIDCIIDQGNVNFASLVVISFVIAAIIAVTAVVQWLMSVINNRIVYGVINDIRKEAFRGSRRLRKAES